jgi:hypothetical protein
VSRDLGLADRMRDAGLDVVEVAGWQTRGSSSFSPRGFVWHHTAGPRTGIAPSLGVCINGRRDLPGPLCNLFLDRAGTVYVVASGRANHAGAGSWAGLTGNASVYGLEIENVGTPPSPGPPGSSTSPPASPPPPASTTSSPVSTASGPRAARSTSTPSPGAT